MHLLAHHVKPKSKLFMSVRFRFFVLYEKPCDIVILHFEKFLSSICRIAIQFFSFVLTSSEEISSGSEQSRLFLFLLFSP